MSETYPVRNQQMAESQAANPTFIEKDEVHVATIVPSQELYPLPIEASSLEAVRVRQMVKVVENSSVPGTTTFPLPAPVADVSGIVVRRLADDTVYTAYTSLVVNPVPDTADYEAVVTWSNPGPVNGEALYVEYETITDLEGAVLSQVSSSVDVSECDFSRVTDTTMTVLYRSETKPLFNLPA